MKLRHGQTFLYDDNDDIVGIRDIDGSEFLFRPEVGVFMDLGDQTDGSGEVELEFDTVVLQRGVRLVDGNRIYVDRAGLYNWHLSVHLHNTAATAYYFDLWGKLNGVNIPNSRFKYTVPGKHGEQPGTIIPSQNFWLQLAAGDYVQIMWAVGNAAVTIAHHAAEVGPPALPAAPSLLLTVNRITD